MSLIGDIRVRDPNWYVNQRNRCSLRCGIGAMTQKDQMKDELNRYVREASSEFEAQRDIATF